MDAEQGTFEASGVYVGDFHKDYNHVSLLIPTSGNCVYSHKIEQTGHFWNETIFTNMVCNYDILIVVLPLKISMPIRHRLPFIRLQVYEISI